MRDLLYQKKLAPKFTPLVVTTFGELGPGAVVVQEWLAMRLKVHHETQARTVGAASGRAHRGSDHGPLSAALPSGIVDVRCPSGRCVSTGVGPPQDVHPGPGAGLGRAPYHTHVVRHLK